MTSGKWAVAAAGVVVGLAFVARYLGHFPSASPNQRLRHFEGVLDHSGGTYDPVLSDLYVRAARALEVGDARSAEALYREAVAKYPRDPEGYSALGTCLFFQDRFREARAEYLRALELDAASAEALYGLGCVGHKEGRYAEARESLEKALSAGADQGLCHYVLGMVHDETGDLAKAVFHYERALAAERGTTQTDYVRQRLQELKR